MALASETVLTALDHFIRAGGGSRGARAILDAEGAARPEAAGVPLDAFRFRPEREADRAGQLVVARDGDGFRVTARPNRPFDETARSVFERDWPDWLTGGIFGGEDRTG